MSENLSDARFVDAWLATRTTVHTRDDARLPAERAAELLLSALAVIGRRSRPILGDGPLHLILTRVIAGVQRTHSFLANAPELATVPLPSSPDGALRLGRAATEQELLAATRLILIDTLAVLSALTGGILRPGLYDALQDTQPPAP